MSEEKIVTYKGTDKDMKCRGYQYEIGKTEKSDGAIRCGDKGFHSCEAPMSVLSYYPVRDGNRFFEAEAGGTIDRTGADDSKVASSELTIKAEIGLPGLVKAQLEYVRKKCETATEKTASGWSGNAAASGDRGNAAASGDSGNAAASGDSGNAAASGDRGNAAASGESGNAAASGESGNAAASGVRGNAAASGVRGAAVVSGMYGSAEASGEQCVAVAWGEDSKARGALGCWLILTEYRDDAIYDAKMVKVDGDTIKADTWYTLHNGAVTIAEEA